MYPILRDSLFHAARDGRAMLLGLATISAGYAATHGLSALVPQGQMQDLALALLTPTQLAWVIVIGVVARRHLDAASMNDCWPKDASGVLSWVGVGLFLNAANLLVSQGMRVLRHAQADVPVAWGAGGGLYLLAVALSGMIAGLVAITLPLALFGPNLPLASRPPSERRLDNAHRVRWVLFVGMLMIGAFASALAFGFEILRGSMALSSSDAGSLMIVQSAANSFVSAMLTGSLIGHAIRAFEPAPPDAHELGAIFS